MTGSHVFSSNHISLAVGHVGDLIAMCIAQLGQLLEPWGLIVLLWFLDFAVVLVYRKTLN